MILLLLVLLPVRPAPATAQSPVEIDLADGRFFTQAGNGVDAGFAITDRDGILFYREFQQQGGVPALGYPLSDRFVYKGFVTQILQKAVLQWQPDPDGVGGQVYYVNVFDELSAMGRDDWLASVRSTPPPTWLPNEERLSFEERMQGRLAWLDENPAIRARYFAVPDPIRLYGLPTSPVTDQGNAWVVRFQRAVMQQWKVDVPWARQGEVTVANGGDVAREAGLFPAEALVPRSAKDGRPVGAPVLSTTGTVVARATPSTTPLPVVSPVADRVPLEVIPAGTRKIVALDPGHGGSDPGTQARYPDGTVLYEKQATLNVALKVANLLRGAGYTVVLTRQTDMDVNSRREDLNNDGVVNWRDDLQARVDIANNANADVFVSLHFNGFTRPEIRGTEVYYNPDRSIGKENQRLAQLVQDSLYAALVRWGYTDTVYRGAKVDVTGVDAEHYFLLSAADLKRVARATRMPTVIAEPLFMTNPQDAAVIRQESAMNALARGYAAAISRFLNGASSP